MTPISIIHQAQDASSRLLDRPASADLLQERTAELALPKTLTRRGTKSAVIFRLAEEWFALPAGVFQEVAENSVVHSVPHHRGCILNGLVNVRGDLLLCVSLEALLGIGQKPTAAQTGSGQVFPRLLVCNRKGDRFAFPVSDVSGVCRYNPEDLRAVPATLASATAGTFTKSMLPWNSGMAGCLDDELLFYSLNKGLT